MLPRFLAAIAGGVLITALMLIGMSQFTAIFRDRSSDRLFLIDILPAPERGRPVRPGAAALPPQREVDRLGGDGSDVQLDELEPGGETLTIAPAAAQPTLGTPPPGRPD